VDAFGTRLTEALDARGPLCVGIDPHASLLAQWGLPDSPDGLERFSRTVTDALGDLVPVLKPQSAFFERFGHAGIKVLESTIRHARESGALVLLDVKRGDIGSTAEAYADAYQSIADAITVHPYLGTIEPFIRPGKGLFVVALSSNPEGRTIQLARTEDGRTVVQYVIDEAARHNRGPEMGDVGVVVGATAGETGIDLSRLNGPILAPGLGAQGATADDLGRVFAGAERAVLPSYSREILRYGPHIDALREAAKRSLAECRKVLKYDVL
jgi:orotidine-5'-phosphate decarboxylase